MNHQAQLKPSSNAPVANPAPAPVATASQPQQNMGVGVGQVPILAPPPQLPPNLMPTLASNPAMGGGNPLFPPPLMLSNGTFLAMPDVFTQQGAAARQAGMMQNVPAMASQQLPGAFNMVAAPGNQAAQAPQAAPMPAAPSTAQPQQTQSAAVPQLVGVDAHAAQAGGPAPTTLGGVPIPALPPHSSTAMQVQVAAAAAAAAAAPLKSAQTAAKGAKRKQPEEVGSGSGRGKRSDLTPEEKAKQNRDRNREHARSTRLRKKAYVQKLKELVDGLHAERTEEVRKRRVAVQHLAEVQSVRRAVVRTFLGFHSSYERDPRKWTTILEDTFWFKQPVTPYRFFRRVEIEQECRVSRGVEAMISDAASLSVMVEGVGSRSTRWMQIKREDFLATRNGTASMPHSIVRQSTRLQHAVSSLSSSSGSSHGSGTDEDRQQAQRQQLLALQPGLNAAENTKNQTTGGIGGVQAPKKVSSSSSSGESLSRKDPSNEFHDYHAPSLPDPKLDGGSSPSSDSPSDAPNVAQNASAAGGKHVSTDSSSGDEDKAGPSKRQKLSIGHIATGTRQSAGAAAAMSRPAASVGHAAPAPLRSGLPPNIAKSGGITHNIRPVVPSGASTNPRLSTAPAIALPPFAGIGKRAQLPPRVDPTTVGTATSQVVPGATTNNPAVASSVVSLARDSTNPKAVSSSSAVAVTSSSGVAGTDENSSNSSNQPPQIQAYYHVNEDDLLLTEDVLMCPFIFRSQDAVMCGALAECIMPGMLRAHFSPRNKLMSLEMVYDAMGFMQQLERASGTEGTAQIVPSSLEMALSPTTSEARVITLAKPPFLIVSVNEAWTRTTKYTQMEVEGKQLNILNGEKTDLEAGVRSGKPTHKFEEVAKGQCACSVNIHYDKKGKEFVNYMCSYPLTNANDEITHLLHVCKVLHEPASRIDDFVDSNSNETESG